MAIPVKLEVFEGPLDLLLHLIDINKIDIYDIPIALITDQYLEYIQQMQKKDMEVMSEFLVMAVTLLKSRRRRTMKIREQSLWKDFWNIRCISMRQWSLRISSLMQVGHFLSK